MHSTHCDQIPLEICSPSGLVSSARGSTCSVYVYLQKIMGFDFSLVLELITPRCVYQGQLRLQATLGFLYQRRDVAETACCAWKGRSGATSAHPRPASESKTCVCKGKTFQRAGEVAGHMMEREHSLCAFPLKNELWLLQLNLKLANVILSRLVGPCVNNGCLLALGHVCTHFFKIKSNEETYRLGAAATLYCWVKSHSSPIPPWGCLCILVHLNCDLIQLASSDL